MNIKCLTNLYSKVPSEVENMIVEHPKVLASYLLVANEKEGPC